MYKNQQKLKPFQVLLWLSLIVFLLWVFPSNRAIDWFPLPFSNCWEITKNHHLVFHYLLIHKLEMVRWHICQLHTQTIIYFFQNSIYFAKLWAIHVDQWRNSEEKVAIHILLLTNMKSGTRNIFFLNLSLFMCKMETIVLNSKIICVGLDCEFFYKLSESMKCLSLSPNSQIISIYFSFLTYSKLIVDLTVRGRNYHQMIMGTSLMCSWHAFASL